MSAATTPTTGAASTTRPDEVMARLQQFEDREDSRRRIRQSWIWVTRVGLLVAFLGLWEYLASSGAINEAFFSKPSRVWSFVYTQAVTGEVWPHVIVTLRETVLAFLLGSAAGIAAAMARMMSDTFAQITDPFITFLNSLPRVALAPMFVIWFGLGEASKVALAVSLVFFITLITTEAGARSIDREYIKAMKSMCATKRQVFSKVMLPGSVPAIFAGLRLAVVYSLLGVVFGEMLAAKAGLGFRIQFYGTTFQASGVLGSVLFLAVLALLLNAVVARFERKFSSWAA